MVKEREGKKGNLRIRENKVNRRTREEAKIIINKGTGVKECQEENKRK